MLKKLSNSMQFRTPAAWWGEKWREGLFSANGNIGANVFGGAVNERILLNHSSLFWQGRTNVVPDVSQKMKEIRRLMDAGDYLKAQNVLPEALSQKNFRPQSDMPLPVGEWNVNFNTENSVNDYTRLLDMSTGEVKVDYRDGTTKVERRLFVSRENDCVVYEIKKNGAKPLNVDFSFTFVNGAVNEDERKERLPDGAKYSCDKQFYCFAAKDDDGTDFGMVAKFTVTGGIVKEENQTIYVTNANSVLVLIKVFAKGSAEREWQRAKGVLTTIKDGYDKLLKPHAVKHQKILGASLIDFGLQEDKEIEGLLLDTSDGTIPALLVEKLFNYGRYLTVSLTQEKGQLNEPFLPTGLFNGSYSPHRAFPSLDGQLQGSYLSALTCGQASIIEELFDYYERWIGDYKDNALRIFNCRGIFIPTVLAPNTGRLGLNDVFSDFFTGCGGWLCNLFFKYYFQNGNSAFGKRLLAFAKEVANFYADLYVEKNGVLEACPQVLPIRVFDTVKIKDRPVISKNSALDYAIARDFYTNYIKLLKEFPKTEEEKAQGEEMLKKLPQYEVATDGVIKEFFNSPISADYSQISVGTLYPAFFSKEVDSFSDEQTKETYYTTAIKKLSQARTQHGYNMAALCAVFTRLEKHEKASECLTNVVRGCAMSNFVMVDKDWRGMGVCGNGDSSPMQLQINLLLSHVIAEMLLYSKGKTVKLMPCFPFACPNLSVKSLITDSGIDVSFSFNAKAETLTVELKAKSSIKIDLYLPANYTKQIKISGCSIADSAASRLHNVKLDANKAAVLVYKRGK